MGEKNQYNEEYHPFFMNAWPNSVVYRLRLGAKNIYNAEVAAYTIHTFCSRCPGDIHADANRELVRTPSPGGQGTCHPGHHPRCQHRRTF